MKKTVIITGASSGFGYALSETLVQQGHIVYATARNVDAMKPLADLGCHVMAMDVSDDASVTSVIEKILKDADRVDAVYTNAGMGEYGLIEEPKLEKIKYMFEVNLFGVARVHNAVLTFLRNQGFGRLIITGSLVGNVSFPGFGWYASSKHALRAMSEALRMEVMQFGIDIILIEPGSVKTNFLSVAGPKIYEATHYEENNSFMTKLGSFMESSYAHAPGMEETITAMVDALENIKPKWVYQTTKTARRYSLYKRVLSLKQFTKRAMKSMGLS